MRQMIFLLLRLTGVPFILRALVQRSAVTILCYHDPRSDVFERHLGVLRRLYNIISLQQFIEARRSGQLDTLPKNALVVTLDDGHKGNYLLLSALRSRGISASIFLCSAIVGTNRHYWWTECPDARCVEALKAMCDEERPRRLRALGFEDEAEYPERQSLSRQEVEQLCAVVDFQ